MLRQRMRAGVLVAGLCLVGLVCAGCSSEAATSNVETSSSDETTAVIVADAAVVIPTQEPHPPTPILPDPNRWVVIADWTAESRDAGLDSLDEIAGVTLELAPVDDAGVADPHQRIQLNYAFGSIDSIDRRMPDGPADIEVINFDFEGGIGRLLQPSGDDWPAGAIVWLSGTFVTMTPNGPAPDLIEVAKSLRTVDVERWRAARSGARDEMVNALRTVAADLPAPPDLGEPLPHVVLVAPWELDWVTDMTIWTQEERQLRAAYGESMMLASTFNGPDDFAYWELAFKNSPDSLPSFAPGISFSMSHFDPPNPTVAYISSEAQPIEALGMTGQIEFTSGSSAFLTLRSGGLEIGLNTTTVGAQGLQDFLNTVAFATENPFDGLDLTGSGYELTDLPGRGEDAEPVEQASWHASWKRPGQPNATVSLTRMTVDELRSWAASIPDIRVPDDIWATIEAGGEIDFAGGTTYDVEANLLWELHGVERAELVPIDLADWIELATPFNSDPVRPR